MSTAPQKFSFFSWMETIPGGLILVPLVIGMCLNTFVPSF